MNFNNLLERLDRTLSGIFRRTFALADLLDFLLRQVESNLSASCKDAIIKTSFHHKNVHKKLNDNSNRDKQRLDGCCGRPAVRSQHFHA